ncbi:hypothetical protein C2G38_2165246 [Gigaspora rosea]|uniref:TLDc domain-containing protein n=1 Tax=Gigaspora rosea TaxID=44941 RepID=A0A397VT15_9GLOM|nr:hypothetical protein C2G38_2165246 [Gigaspora rosea]
MFRQSFDVSSGFRRFARVSTFRQGFDVSPRFRRFVKRYATTADSFIFSLKNGNLNQSILSRVKDTSIAINYGSISQGPWFSGNDLGMGNISDPKKWHCKKYAYDKPIRTSDGWFSIDEYEVFQVCKNI